MATKSMTAVVVDEPKEERIGQLGGVDAYALADILRTDADYNAADVRAKNSLRVALIKKKYASGLSVDEMEQLENLNAFMDTYVDSIAPLPTLAKI